MIITRRGLAAFAAFLALTLAGSATAGTTTADAFSTGYGGAKKSCVTVLWNTPSGPTLVSKCGHWVHNGVLPP